MNRLLANIAKLVKVVVFLKPFSKVVEAHEELINHKHIEREKLIRSISYRTPENPYQIGCLISRLSNNEIIELIRIFDENGNFNLSLKEFRERKEIYCNSCHSLVKEGFCSRFNCVN